MLRLTLLVTGVLSFLYFLNPGSFAFFNEGKDKVLGIDTLNQTINSSVVQQAVLIYCINNQKLPENLNILYESELSKQRFLDLDKLYKLEKKADCEFSLKARS